MCSGDLFVTRPNDQTFIYVSNCSSYRWVGSWFRVVGECLKHLLSFFRANVAVGKCNY